MTADQRMDELTWQMLDFHRRADKPAWWAMYDRMEASEDELLEDVECLAGLELDPAEPPQKVKKSTVYTYRAPEQETKLKSGDPGTRVETGQPLSGLEVDEATRRVRVKVGPGKELPSRLSLGPGQPLNAGPLVEALYRFADNRVEKTGRYLALERLLRRDLPVLEGRRPGQPIVDPALPLMEGCVAAVERLSNSTLYVQGPPGAGKTYTGSRMIAHLLERGARVGIMSNSHKAINHLLDGVMKVLATRGLHVTALKKGSGGRADTEYEGAGPVRNVTSNGDVWGSDAQLVAGTAWLFADEDADQALDVLFVDEAGQVALANLVAAGTSARNLVLLGDQMQLGQPVQGVHPGRSGDSTLDYLLDGEAAIPPERGIFLATTWRMHPDVCPFISDAVYDGRLNPEPGNARRHLVLAPDAHPLLRAAGLVHAPLSHEGCSQRCEPEAQLVAALYQSAMGQRYVDDHGREQPMTARNVLVVAPYNMQVNLLKRTLPEGARVGTVDKFQGQEAEVVIVSMTTSSEHDLPRHLEFFYSKNRLNVAISRAKCLAIVIANPALMAIKCATPEQMALVNTLCWVAEAGKLA